MGTKPPSWRCSAGLPQGEEYATLPICGVYTLIVGVLTAIVDIIQHIALHPDSAFDYNRRDTDLGGLAPVAREKRRVDWTRAPGATLAFYRDILALVVRAWEYYGIDIVKTDLVQHMISLGGDRRNPRDCLSAIGAPDSPVTAATTEATSTQVPSELPTTPAPPASSSRRKARLSDYVAAGSSVVRNIDSSTAFSEKLAPAPQSPSKDPTPSSPLLVDYEDRSAPTPNSRPKIFRVPSFEDSSTACDDGGETSQLSLAEDGHQNEHFSPIQRPGAPTPSRWDRTEAPAGQIETPQPSAESCTASKGPLGLMGSIPATIASPQHTPPSWRKFKHMPLPKTNAFQFSDAPFEDTQASDHYSVFGGKSDRRRSEPLLQHLLKDQARRFSASPQKFFAGSDRFDETQAAGPSTPVRPKRVSIGPDFRKLSIDGDFYTPLPAYFRSNLVRGPSNVNDTPANRNGVYNIDMRENLDIFGVHRTAAAQEDSIKELGGIAEDRSGGSPQAVTTHVDGTPVVQFKLPAKCTSILPDSQGQDELHLTTTPLAVSSSSSPRVRCRRHHGPSPGLSAEPAIPEESSNGHEDFGDATYKSPNPTKFDETQSESTRKVIESDVLPLQPRADDARAFGAGVAMSTHLADVLPSPAKGTTSPGDDDGTLIVDDFDGSSFEERAAETAAEMALPCRSEGDAHDESTLILTPTRQLQREALEAPSSSIISDVTFEPAFQTPTFGHIDFSPTKGRTPNTPTTRSRAAAISRNICGTQSPRTEAESERSMTTTTLKEAPQPVVTAAPETTPTPPASFTPVNKPSATISTRKPAEDSSSNEPEGAQQPDAQLEISAVAAPQPAKIQYDDSPGRDFMYDFIRRSKPKRLTTETGSPVPGSGPAARVPLGAKSPNAGSPSPRKEKRKADDGVPESGSPLKEELKQAEEPAAKKARTKAKPVKKAVTTTKKTSKQDTAAKDQVNETKETCKGTAKPETSNSGGAEEPPRRSTRLRSQHSEREAAPLKSSIPTAIRLGRPAAGRASGGRAVNSAVRNEQVELTRQTSLNTRKNKGGAESVQKVLARFSEELSGGDSDGSAMESKVSKTTKNVSWMDPIASHQQTPKAKATKTGATKPRATPGSTGLTKIRAPAKPRVSQAARKLGMASNGTPAKRMTRAQTRSTG